MPLVTFFWAWTLLCATAGTLLLGLNLSTLVTTYVLRLLERAHSYEMSTRGNHWFLGAWGTFWIAAKQAGNTPPKLRPFSLSWELVGTNYFRGPFNWEGRQSPFSNGTAWYHPSSGGPWENLPEFRQHVGNNARN